MPIYKYGKAEINPKNSWAVGLETLSSALADNQKSKIDQQMRLRQAEMWDASARKDNATATRTERQNSAAEGLIDPLNDLFLDNARQRFGQLPAPAGAGASGQGSGVADVLADVTFTPAGSSAGAGAGSAPFASAGSSAGAGSAPFASAGSSAGAGFAPSPNASGSASTVVPGAPGFPAFPRGTGVAAPAPNILPPVSAAPVGTPPFVASPASAGASLPINGSAMNYYAALSNALAWNGAGRDPSELIDAINGGLAQGIIQNPTAGGDQLRRAMLLNRMTPSESTRLSLSEQEYFDDRDYNAAYDRAVLSQDGQTLRNDADNAAAMSRLNLIERGRNDRNAFNQDQMTARADARNESYERRRATPGRGSSLGYGALPKGDAFSQELNASDLRLGSGGEAALRDAVAQQARVLGLPETEVYSEAIPSLYELNRVLDDRFGQGDFLSSRVSPLGQRRIVSTYMRLLDDAEAEGIEVTPAQVAASLADAVAQLPPEQGGGEGRFFGRGTRNIRDVPLTLSGVLSSLGMNDVAPATPAEDDALIYGNRAPAGYRGPEINLNPMGGVGSAGGVGSVGGLTDPTGVGGIGGVNAPADFGGLTDPTLGGLTDPTLGGLTGGASTGLGGLTDPTGGYDGGGYGVPADPAITGQAVGQAPPPNSPARAEEIGLYAEMIQAGYNPAEIQDEMSAAGFTPAEIEQVLNAARGVR